jgi:hypothetical protein
LFLREHCLALARRGRPRRPAFAIVGTLRLIYARILCLCGLISVRTPATALIRCMRPGADHASDIGRERESAMQQPSGKTLIVTGCDENHHELALDLITSLRDLGVQGAKIAFVDMGTQDPPQNLLKMFDLHAKQTPGTERYKGYKCAFLAIKARLPSIFPGFETYIWLDADCWVQNADAVGELVDAAQRADVAVHPELDVHYFAYKSPSDRTIMLYGNLYGQEISRQMWRFPMINGGVFSARANSKVWTEWSVAMESIRTRWKQGEDISFSDQIPLHLLIHTKKLSIYPLRAVNNWQLYAALPLIDKQEKRIVVPTPPHEPINILHLAGVTKGTEYYAGRLQKNLSFRYRDIKKLLSEL